MFIGFHTYGDVYILSIWTYAVKYNMAVPMHLNSKTMNVDAALESPQEAYIYIFIIIVFV